MIYSIPQHKRIYIIPRKVASTAIRDAIAKDIGESGKWASKYRLEEFKNPNNYEVIGFVRNPYDRLVSVYHNQCLGENRYGLWHGIDFESFARYIYTTPYYSVDKHFMQQSMILMDHCDRIIKFENLNTRWKDLKLPDLRIVNKSDRKHWMEYYDAVTLSNIYRYYYQDFLAFGYASHQDTF